MDADEHMQNIKTIHLASDHAGFELKESIHDWLLSEGYDVVDHGAYEYDEDDDYPDYIAPAAHAVSVDPERSSRAIVLGGSGQGEAIMANRFTNVRAVVFNGQYESHDPNREIPEEVVTFTRFSLFESWRSTRCSDSVFGNRFLIRRTSH
jgi:RpiB/LacA/LacB family sugar-phosphate isomerase